MYLVNIVNLYCKINKEKLMKKSLTKKQQAFKTLKQSVFYSGNIMSENFNPQQIAQNNQMTFEALGVEDGLQMMLATQMIGIHNLLKDTLIKAHAIDSGKEKQYYTNSSIKLANTFTQQAALLNKLQGNNSQKIVVEHVDVHDGGQAIVGAITKGVGENK